MLLIQGTVDRTKHNIHCTKWYKTISCLMSK